MFTLLLISVVRLRDETATARRASDGITQSVAVERLVVDLETGLRGYLITRQPQFLEPFAQARSRIPAELAHLNAYVQTRRERADVATLAASITDYINTYALPLIATHGKLATPEAIRATSVGKQRLDALRSQFTRLEAAQAQLAEARRRAVDASSRNSAVAAATGLGLTVLLLGALSVFILRRILIPTRTLAAAVELLGYGQLSVRVPALGRGELAILARSFNEMASELQTRDGELARAHSRLSHALEEAHAASTMKSNFVANMSHEIRTPLNGVVGMLELLGETRLTAEQHEYVRVARASGEALMTVVNDVLDVAKIEAGRLELEHHDFDLHDVVEAACDMVAATAKSRRLELQSFVHDDVPQLVRGDRMCVGQILANLLSNAVKFTPEGEVVLEVTRAGATDTHSWVRFVVRDTGIGISPERISALFEPFTQADTGTTRTYGGTGLGLTIVRELTSLMGGTIHAESELGCGSTFVCTLPITTVPSTRERAHDEQSLRGLRVLVVDDNATNRRIFEAYAASWGMRPAQAHDAATALAALVSAAQQGDGFDVALLDFQMPGRSGLELARDINASSALRRTRIILLTSSGQLIGDDLPDGLVAAVLSKPVRQSKLLDAITVAMSLVPAGPEPATHAQEAVLTPTPTGCRILVAEDQPVNWLLVQRFLSKRGHHVVNAPNGKLALEMLERERYDLVLMDCQMPELDGYATAREIRRREPATGAARLPIVAMTAHAMPGDRERCLAAGMDDYLPKPITSEAVDAILDTWLPAPDVEQPSKAPVAGAPVATSPLVDPGRMAELRSLFPGQETSQLLHQLCQDVDDQFERIGAAITVGRGDEVAHGAHSILNSAHMIAASGLIEAATTLESVAHDADEARAAESALRARWVTIRDALREAW